MHPKHFYPRTFCKLKLRWMWLMIIISLGLPYTAVEAGRVKDLASFQGVRSNKLLGLWPGSRFKRNR